MKYTIVALLLLLTGVSSIIAQQASISGTIITENNEPMLGVSVILEKTSVGTVSDRKGKYSIKNITPGTYTLTASSIGFGDQRKTISIASGQNYIFDFVLYEQVQALDEVVLQGKSKAQILREEAYAVEVVEIKGLKNLATNGNDILAKVSGVNVRESGGVGSDFTLSLNGLSGNQVRMFLDGIPMDYFGTSLTLNNFSANLLEQIEVYKGVVPIHLSSDALGGAINIVTNQSASSFLDVSYSTGSFGTHIASLNTQYRNKKSGFTTRLMTFYNYSDNNYKVPVQLTYFDENGVGRQDDFFTEVERFHDAYESKMAWLQTGFTKTKFADQLMVGVMYSDNYNELQQPASALGGPPAVPFGDVIEKEQTLITNFSYRKKGLFTDKLNMDLYFVGVFSDTEDRDISDYKYDWLGNQTRYEPNYGEIDDRKTHLFLDIENYLGRINSEYVFNDNNNIAGHFNINRYTIQGTDDYKAANIQQFREPSTVNKQIAAFSYTNSSFNQKFKNTVFAKIYDYELNTVETDYTGSTVEDVVLEKDHFGYGFTSTLLLGQLQIKASYENALRFPESYELFGDGVSVTPNPVLEPETTNNYNLGFIFRPQIFTNPFTISINGFVRDSEDFIRPIPDGPFTQFVNFQNVRSAGADVSVNYIIDNKWFFNLNGSLVDKRDRSLEKIDGKYPRVPNEPYLFGNLSSTYRKQNFFKQGDNLAVTITQGFRNEFPLYGENIADPDLGKAVVPEQWTTDFELVYSLKNERYNFSLGIVNLWDTEVYDNFQQLKPGRTFNFKLRYFIN